MELIDHSVPAMAIKSGRETSLEMVAGKILKIETSPEGADILNETVPDGKVWTVTINIDIIETNA